jgi:hypothetical protein
MKITLGNNWGAFSKMQTGDVQTKTSNNIINYKYECKFFFEKIVKT